MSVALTDEGRIEILPIDYDVPQKPTVAVPRVSGHVGVDPHDADVKVLCSECGGFRPEILHWPGGMFRFRSIDSDEPDDVALTLNG